MKYNLNDEVYVLDSDNPKKIVDKEIIDGKEIYYMSDESSYEETEIKLTLSEFMELKTLIYQNKNLIKNHIVNALQTYWDNRKNKF